MNLNGWDVAFVASVDYINGALAQSTDHLIQEFDSTEQDFHASGKFGTWSIVPGGSGNLLMLQLEIASGEVVHGGAPAIDIGGMSVVFQVSLQFLPIPGKPTGQSLSFQFSQNSSKGAAPGAVSPHAMNDGGKLTPMQKAALASSIADALVAGAGSISFVFATVDPEQAVGVDWLKPVVSGYAYVPPSDKRPAMLAVLSMTSAHDIAALPLTVDPALLPDTGNAGMAISTNLFLGNVFAPVLASSLQTQSSLAVAASGTLQNTQQLSLPDVKGHTPAVNSLSATVVDDRINISLSGECDMNLGASLTFDASSVVQVSFDAATHKINFAQVGDPAFHSDRHVPWYDHLIDIFALGTPEIAIQVVTHNLASAMADSIGSVTGLSSLATSAPSIVSWSGKSRFAPQAGGLATAFYLHGSIVEPATSFEEIDEENSVSAQSGFGAWTIAEAGRSETMIYVDISLLGGAVTISGAAYPFAACLAAVEVNWEFVDPTKPFSPQNVTIHAARIRDVTPWPGNILAQAALNELLEIWLNKNLPQFTLLIRSGAQSS